MILGIDLGTTSVKISLVKIKFSKIDEDFIDIIWNKSQNYHEFKNQLLLEQRNKSDFIENLVLKTGEIDVNLVLKSLQNCINYIPDDLAKQIKAIGFCGQMHGCLFFKNKPNPWSYDSKEQKFKIKHKGNISNFITWEDQRCSKEFLNDLPNNAGVKKKVHTGFACATVFWYLKYDKDFLEKFNYFCSLMDFIIVMLCDLQHPITSEQIATSFGYYNFRNHCWDLSLKNNNFPHHMLPKVVKDNTFIAYTKYTWFKIKKKLPVLVGLGDLQCAIYSSLLNKKNCAVLNSGTSMQLAFLIECKLFNEKFNEFNSKLSKNVEILPYFNNDYLITGSSLNGGNVIHHFVNKIKNLIIEITGDKNINEDKIYSILVNKALENLKNLDENKSSVKLNIIPTLFGERNQKNIQYFSINSITEDNFNLGNFFCKLCDNLLENIFKLVSLSDLKYFQINKIRAIGNTINRNEILRFYLKDKLKKNKLNLEYQSNLDANVGIALIVNNNLTSKFSN